MDRTGSPSLLLALAVQRPTTVGLVLSFLTTTPPPSVVAAEFRVFSEDMSPRAGDRAVEAAAAAGSVHGW